MTAVAQTHGDDARRTELAAFLRARRTGLDRSVVGLPEVARRRVRGLRREEVATLSGVSVTWYTWLEQARDVAPSRQVLDALAGTLRLTLAEHGYLLSLAGYAPAPAVPDAVPRAPAHLQRLIDALAGMPAYAITHDWTICGWNAAYAELYPNVATVAEADRNLLWLVFTDPSVRTLLPDWELTSRHFLAEFHAGTAGRLGSPTVARLVARLTEHSAEFRAGWADRPVQGFASRLRTFVTPTGRREYEHHRLAPADHPDLSIVIYTPVRATGSDLDLDAHHHGPLDR